MMKKQYTLGLVSVSFRHNTPNEIVEAAVSAGLECIEWGSDVHAPCDNKERLAEIAALQEKYGIYCSSYGTYFRLGETPISELLRYIEAAKALGTDILRLWCGTRCGAEYTSEERSELLAICKEAAKTAKESGVRLCMECHKKSFTERLSDALWLIDAVDSPFFCMYWQPFQWKCESDNLEYAKAIAPYTEHIHVFNWKEKEKLPLALAVDEWKSYLSCFDTPRTLLLEFMPNGTTDELLCETKALRSIVGEII